MNFISSINIGDRIEIFSTDNKDKKKDIHVSQVENILDEKRILAHVPMTNLNKKGFVKNIQYEILIFTSEGVISFIGTIESYTKEDGFNLMIIKILNNGEKIQRRKFFRFSCYIPFKFKVIENEKQDFYFYTKEDEKEGCYFYKEENYEFKAKSQKNIYYGILVDLSSNGMRFYSNKKIEKPKKIKAIFQFDDLLIIEGKIIKKDIIYKNGYKYQYRIEFDNILPKEQEKIVNFIFEEQQKALYRIGKK